MNDPRSNPTETHQIFEHSRVADGYASARPFLHREVFARVRDLVPAPWPLRRGLDVGCGTGLSSVALLELVRDVTAVDVSLPMLRRAERREHVRYLASSAEDLPLRDGTFDLILACGSLDWVDRARFLPRAAELLTTRGWLIPLDFGDAGRSADMVDLERWHRQVFQTTFPSPSSRDPMITGREASRFGFDEPTNHTFETECSFTASRYARFLMTESRITAAVEYGHRSAEEIRAWLEGELGALFQDRACGVNFQGYIQVLSRH